MHTAGRMTSLDYFDVFLTVHLCIFIVLLTVLLLGVCSVTNKRPDNNLFRGFPVIAGELQIRSLK